MKSVGEVCYRGVLRVTSNSAATTFNFYSGPAMLPPEVLAQAAAEMSSGRPSVMEISHRSKEFGDVLTRAETGLRELMGIPSNYKVLFLQGGATLQFSMIPMNLLASGASADHVITGAWSKKAAKEAARYGGVTTIFSDEQGGFRTAPARGTLRVSTDASYLHYCSNETIDGVEFDHDIDGGRVPVVCDMSSNILSKPIDVDRYALIYAGAQKNIGPSGVTVVIIREDLLERKARDLPGLLTYSELADNGSMLNTPNTWGVYMIGLVCDWLQAKGGVAAIAELNAKKAEALYAAIDSSDGFYEGHADTASRSRMNVTFNLPNAELENAFCTEAEAAGLIGLRGHRSVGGIRASIYNAFPLEGVEALVELMSDFAGRKG